MWFLLSLPFLSLIQSSGQERSPNAAPHSFTFRPFCLSKIEDRCRLSPRQDLWRQPRLLVTFLFVGDMYMRLNPGLQACIGTVDAAGRFVPLCLHEKRDALSTNTYN